MLSKISDETFDLVPGDCGGMHQRANVLRDVVTVACRRTEGNILVAMLTQRVTQTERARTPKTSEEASTAQPTSTGGSASSRASLDGGQ